MKTTVDVLREAKAILSNETRRCTNIWWEDQGGGTPISYCAVGAIFHVATGEAKPMPERGMDALADAAVDALASAIGKGDDWIAPTFFNDDPATTHDQVIDAFDRAIIAESAKLAQPEREPERVSVG